MSGSADWLCKLESSLLRDPVVARVVVAGVRGSAPREAGAAMLVRSDAVLGTIGGGRLEWDAAAAARSLSVSLPARRQRVVLGAERAQCCGGVVELWMERFTRADLPWLRAAACAAGEGPALLETTLRGDHLERRLVGPASGGAADELLRRPRAEAAPELRQDADGTLRFRERLDDGRAPLWLYGAGHVGQALARIVVELPFSLTWVDSRADQFPAGLAPQARIVNDVDPVASVAGAPAGTRFLIMTHSHALDYALCRAILRRGDFLWAGLIGSASKAARFRSRLARDGIGGALLERLTCPIGVGGIDSKWPAAIAVSVAAQLLRGAGGTPSAVRPAPAATAAASGCETADCTRCGMQPA